jgi:hypothetical protein
MEQLVRLLHPRMASAGYCANTERLMRKYNNDAEDGELDDSTVVDDDADAAFTNTVSNTMHKKFKSNKRPHAVSTDTGPGGGPNVKKSFQKPVYS